jgi:hypothetical protein
MLGNKKTDDSRPQSVENEELERTKSEEIEQMANGYQPGTDEERKLVRKIDLFLMPNIFIMYLLSYMDRTK